MSDWIIESVMKVFESDWLKDTCKFLFQFGHVVLLFMGYVLILSLVVTLATGGFQKEEKEKTEVITVKEIGHAEYSNLLTSVLTFPELKESLAEKMADDNLISEAEYKHFESQFNEMCHKKTMAELKEIIGDRMN